MPTGYTADVADGKVTDFRTFALRCARAFGATIMQRDDPMGEPPKHREPSDYYAKSLESARANLANLEGVSPEAAEALCAANFASLLASHNRYEAERIAENNRYNAMLAQVIEWEPPTTDHEELKRFMIEQIHTSRNDYEPVAPTKPDAATWLRESIEHARDSVARAEKGIAEEQARCASANQWIDALYASLDVPAIAGGRTS